MIRLSDGHYGRVLYRKLCVRDPVSAGHHRRGAGCFLAGTTPAQAVADDQDEQAEDDARAIDGRVTTQPPPAPGAAGVGVRGVVACAGCGLYGWLGAGHIYTQQAMFFSQVAVVTFGGAYAVLSYMRSRPWGITGG